MSVDWVVDWEKRVRAGDCGAGGEERRRLADVAVGGGPESQGLVGALEGSVVEEGDVALGGGRGSEGFVVEEAGCDLGGMVNGQCDGC